jgi:hypothetical protein
MANGVGTVELPAADEQRSEVAREPQPLNLIPASFFGETGQYDDPLLDALGVGDRNDRLDPAPESQGNPREGRRSSIEGAAWRGGAGCRRIE